MCSPELCPFAILIQNFSAMSLRIFHEDITLAGKEEAKQKNPPVADADANVDDDEVDNGAMVVDDEVEGEEAS